MMSNWVQISQKILAIFFESLQAKTSCLFPSFQFSLVDKLVHSTVVSDWMSRFSKSPDDFYKICMENPWFFKALHVDEWIFSPNNAKLMENAASIPIKLRKRITRLLAQISSLPAQIAWFFSKMPFIEKNLLYPRYQHYLKEHLSNLPELDSMDSRIVEELRQTGICVTSLESLGLPNTAEFFEAAKKLSQDLSETSLLPAYKDRHEIIATSDQLMKYKELFHWGLNERFLKIVERYLGLPVAYDGLLFTLGIADGREIGARSWHRDREDRRMIKVCVYLNDVDDNGGPFQCLQPQANSLLCNSVKYRYKSVFNEELQAFSLFGSEGVVTCTGLTGTVIFVDTAVHYHRGKPPTESNRFAVFFSYFSRRPWHPFFCQRSPLSREELDCLTQEMPSYERDCVNWKDELSWLAKSIPRSRI
jgi:hypothetical protein